MYSIDDLTSIKFKPGKSRSLQNHSDNNASGINCTNQIKFYLSIPASALRKAKAGTYYLAFSTSTSTYSGR